MMMDKDREDGIESVESGGLLGIADGLDIGH
jgi:hypothetical protein